MWSVLTLTPMLNTPRIPTIKAIRLPGAKTYGVSVGDYTFFDGPLSGLTVGTGGRFTGSSYGDPANSFKVGSYTVVDALVRYDWHE